MRVWLKLCPMSITPEAPAKTLTQLVATQIKLQMVLADDIKQSQLARKIGKTEQWLSVRLRGRQPLDVNDLALIADGLGVGVHDLLPPPEAVARVIAGVSHGAGGAGDRATQTIVPDHSTVRPMAEQPISRPAAARVNRHVATTGGPYGGGRRDATRPVSAVPFSKRRPARIGSGNRPITD
jgi:transcriptional regulator with XRE-family HTH domain